LGIDYTQKSSDELRTLIKLELERNERQKKA
jgi:hypothetical protein